MKNNLLFVFISFVFVGVALGATWFIFTGSQAGQKVIDTMDASLPGPASPGTDASKHLRLMGVAFNAKGEPSVVIADTIAGTQGLYKEGDSVGGAKIIEIYPDSAMLILDAKTFTLKLEKSGAGEKQLSTDDLLQEPPSTLLYDTQAEVEQAGDGTRTSRP